jgi:alcohol dehydrogenase class IV
MVPFAFETPRTIHLGVGALQKLPGLVDGLGGRALLVTGARWYAESPWRARISAALASRACGHVCLSPGEPSVESLAAAAEEAARFSPDVLVAVGGGSVVDSTKALSALLRYPGPAERFLEGLPGMISIPGPGLPWVAVPTTAGTGAEVTKNAVVRAPGGVKRSMRSLDLLASAVIVDPQLTVSLPLDVTGTSGLDALTQLVEAYVSKGTNPFVQSIVEGAIGPMLAALEGLPSDPSNEALRAQASYGALVSGMALANAGLGAAHGFAAAVGGMFGVPHGLACAVFLPHVLAANAPLIREPMTRLLSRLPGAPAAEDPVAWLGEKVKRILAAFGLPADLRSYRIPRDRLAEIAEKSSGSSMRYNPKDLPAEERIRILSAVA